MALLEERRTSSPRFERPASFLIPSIHDGTQLECRIYHPEGISSTKGAIIAHPYGPLGGSFDDHVVQTTVSTFVSEGYIVGTFNFRGVGASKGRTSWSSKPELADYASFISFFLIYMHYFLGHTATASDGDREGSESDPRPESETSVTRLSLVLGGYSYGAMITVELPSPEVILGRFKDASKDYTESKLEEIAQHQAETQDAQSSSQQVKIENVRSSVPTVSYLLISPLLPPVSWAIAMPVPQLPFRSSHGQGQDTTTRSTSGSKKLFEDPTLAIYSDNDQFTGIKKLQKWSADLQSHNKSQFRCYEVAGAGHFWQKEGSLEEVQRRLRDWLRT